MDTVKLTLSVKRRMPDGSEVFIAPGIERHCSTEDRTAVRAEVTEEIQSWITELLELYPDSDPIEDEEEGDEEADDDEEEAEEIDIDELDDESIEALAEHFGIKAKTAKGQRTALKKKDPDEIAAAYDELSEEEGEEEEEGDEEEAEEIDVDELDDESVEALADYLKVKAKTIKAKRLALKKVAADELAAAYDELSEDEDEEEGDEEEEEGEEEDLTEEDLKAMGLEELQNLCDEFEIDHPKVPKGTKLAAKKKLYVEHIIEAMEEE